MFLPKTKKSIFAFLALLLLVCAGGVTLFSSRSTSVTNKKVTDIHSLKELLANPAYAAQVDYFLKLDGIPGESTDSTHPNEIQLDSFQWGVNQKGTQTSGGGGGAGKVRFQDLHFTMKVNKASPKIFLACANGQHIKNGVLSVRKAGGEQQDFLILSFSDLLCTSYRQTGDPQNLIPEDSLELNFSKVTIKFQSFTPTPAAETGTFDFTQNTAQ